jgi:protein-disulfide isomerase
MNIQQEPYTMHRAISRLRPATLAAVAALGLMILPAQAPALEASDKAEVEAIIREYLLKNPEIMLEVQKALEAKQAQARAENQAKTLADMKERIYSSVHQVEIGDKNAPITIVEFFDYNCGFCQRALADMNAFVAKDKDVRFILKEFPVLGEPSLEAHRVSLAFNRLMPEKAAQFHTELMSLQGRKDGAVATQLALKLGADEAALKAEMEKPEIMDAVREVYELADGLGITGTPSYVIGNEVVFGAVGYDQLNTRVANVRECGKAVC